MKRELRPAFVISGIHVIAPHDRYGSLWNSSLRLVVEVIVEQGSRMRGEVAPSAPASAICEYISFIYHLGTHRISPVLFDPHRHATFLLQQIRVFHTPTPLRLWAPSSQLRLSTAQQRLGSKTAYLVVSHCAARCLTVEV